MPAVMLVVFALTLFLSASLLFIIELMVGKMMLPLMGGTPAVWNTCMVFFQAVLLAGYGFAHAAIKWLGPRNQARLQLVVFVVPFLSIALNALLAYGMLAPNQALVAGHEGNPIPVLLLVLTVCVGLPMFLVCTTAPLLQRWFSSTDHPAARDPYFLYGASNLGSMLGLISYPFVIEPYLTLKSQQVIWVIGFALLAGLVAVCAVLMWKSKPALEAAPNPAPSPPSPLPQKGEKGREDRAGSSAIKSGERHVSRDRAKGSREVAKAQPAEPPAEDDRPRAREPITWRRRLHWVALAMVPSSLMLGVTTYITTDIAAIPFLWMPPLLLYLMTFIIVFAVISPRTQSVIVFAGICLACLTAFFGSALFFNNGTIRFLFLILAGVGVFFGFRVLRLRDSQLIHRVMIILMPLLLLLLLFIMLSEWKQPLEGKPFEVIGWDVEVKISGLVTTLFLHLFTLFIVSMVCHGELAADRPEPKHLTEFFLWMSFGGVLGGLFNGLVAPVIFNSIVEYQLMMVVACLLLPALSGGGEGRWARWIDVALGATILLIGGVLLLVRYRDKVTPAPDMKPFWQGAWMWAAVAAAAAVALWLPQLLRRLRQPPEPDGEKVLDYRLSVVLDLLLPAALLILVLGLYWGLPADGVKGRIQSIAATAKNKITAEQIMTALTFGLPAVLCYTFVERWARFGLGVGALLLAAGTSSMIKEGALYQDRSFFGVLKVEDSYVRFPSDYNQPAEYYFPVQRLVHGTTLHGKQYKDPDFRGLTTSYYHRSGPIGQLFSAYNTDPDRAYAVIGLGTGTMATYGRPGQVVDFFDIDPVVVEITYDTNEFFSFIEDAEGRGVKVSMVLGDARLTFDPRDWRERRKIAEGPSSLEAPPILDDVRQKRMLPLHRRKGEKSPARQYGPDLTSDQKYRLIVVDAFSSDAIPMHLITRQAVQIYLDRLEEDGILCIHISNRHLDLQPVLANIAVELGLAGMHMSDDDAEPPGKNRSHWVALTRKKENLSELLSVPRWQTDADQLPLLALNLYPAQTLGPNPIAGLCYAFSALAEQQAIRGTKETGRSGDPRVAVSDWEPLETTPYLEDLPELHRAEIEALDKRLAEVGKELTALKGPLEEVEKPYSKLIDEGQDTIKRLRDIGETLSELTGTDRTRLLEEQTQLKKKRAEIDAKLEPLQKKKDELKARETWLERLENVMERRKKRLEAAVAVAPDKIKKNRRVGVWTDDYSNLFSVFSW